MPQERTTAPLGSFYKFTKIGQKVAGIIKRYGTGENGPFVNMEPVLIRDGKGEQFQAFLTCGVGLSTDLNLKVNQNDVGKAVSFEFVDTEPTKKGSNKKIFRVHILDRAELVELASDADRSNRNSPYIRQASNDPENDVTDDNDDLPF